MYKQHDCATRPDPEETETMRDRCIHSNTNNSLGGRVRVDVVLRARVGISEHCNMESVVERTVISLSSSSCVLGGRSPVRFPPLFPRPGRAAPLRECISYVLAFIEVFRRRAGTYRAAPAEARGCAGLATGAAGANREARGAVEKSMTTSIFKGRSTR
jgi:hypothetical protein